MALNSIQCRRKLRNARRTVSFLPTFQALPATLRSEVVPIALSHLESRSDQQGLENIFEAGLGAPPLSAAFVEHSPSRSSRETESPLNQSGLFYRQTENSLGAKCRIFLRKSFIS